MRNINLFLNGETFSCQSVVNNDLSEAIEIKTESGEYLGQIFGIVLPDENNSEEMKNFESEVIDFFKENY